MGNPRHPPHKLRGPRPAPGARHSPTPHCVLAAGRECHRFPWTATACRRPGDATVRAIPVPRPRCAPHGFGNGLTVPAGSARVPLIAHCADSSSWSAKVAIVPGAPGRIRTSCRGRGPHAGGVAALHPPRVPVHRLRTRSARYWALPIFEAGASALAAAPLPWNQAAVLAIEAGGSSSPATGAIQEETFPGRPEMLGPLRSHRKASAN